MPAQHTYTSYGRHDESVLPFFVHNVRRSGRHNRFVVVVEFWSIYKLLAYGFDERGRHRRRVTDVLDMCARPPRSPLPRPPKLATVLRPATFCQLLEANGVFACMWFVCNRVHVCMCGYIYICSSEASFSSFHPHDSPVSAIRYPCRHIQPWVSY